MNPSVCKCQNVPLVLTILRFHDVTMICKFHYRLNSRSFIDSHCEVLNHFSASTQHIVSKCESRMLISRNDSAININKAHRLCSSDVLSIFGLQIIPKDLTHVVDFFLERHWNILEILALIRIISLSFAPSDQES